MNELEKLMIAESKKKAIDDKLIKDEQQCEDDKYDNWEMETMDKLRFLENYNFVTLKKKRSRGAFLIHPKKHGTIEVALVNGYEDIAGKRRSVYRYHTEQSLVINWNYGISGGESYTRGLSLENFVKELIRRGIIKVEG